MKNIATNEQLKDTFIEEKQSLIKRIFGCWHMRMSKPVTVEGTTFCYCKDCGLRRKYNFETFEPQGTFYLPLPVKAIHFV